MISWFFLLFYCDTWLLLYASVAFLSWRIKPTSLYHIIIFSPPPDTVLCFEAASFETTGSGYQLFPGREEKAWRHVWCATTRLKRRNAQYYRPPSTATCLHFDLKKQSCFACHFYTFRDDRMEFAAFDQKFALVSESYQFSLQNIIWSRDIVR